MKLNFVFISTLVAALTVTSCMQKNCGTNIEIPESVLRIANEYNYDYCNLLKMSQARDQKAIRQFSLLHFSDGVSYEHGAVLIDLLDQLSENYYLNTIQSFSKDQRIVVYSSLAAGLDCTQNPKFTRKSFKDAFPELYSFLRSE